MTAPLNDSRGRYIAQMFGAIADHYDLMNWVMTLGQDQRWRRQAADAAEVRNGDVVLDVATGTGDLAFEMAKRIAPKGHVVGLDFAEPMVDIARHKSAQRALPVSFEIADALALPYDDSAFDAVTCGFGVRNFEDREAALREMTRVVRPGRRVVVLELTPPENVLARTYMDEVVPRLGDVIARARAAYSYLPESVKDFPDPVALGKMMQTAGLRQVKYRLLNFGTVALHWGEKG